MSENDIVPELLEKIINDFEENVSLIRAEETFEALLKSNNLEDAYEIAREIGGALSESFSKFITEDILPNGRMYYNIANRIIPPSLQKAYNEAEKFTEVIMSNILSKSKIGIKVQQGLLNQDRIRGIVDRLSEAENYQDVKFLTGKAVVQNVTQSAVDDTIEANAEFHYKSGLRARVERKLGGKCCAWCQKLVGKYTYPDVPEDVYRRHENCRCTVIYYPSKASRGQDVWSKKTVDVQENKNNSQQVENNNNRGRIKAITIDDLNKANIGGVIQQDVIDNISKSLEELDALKSFKSVNITSIPDVGNETVMFQTVPKKVGNWVDFDLNINADAFSGKSLDEINKIFADADNTVCNNIKDALAHEKYHARLYDNMTYAQMNALDDELSYIHVEGFTDTAYINGGECISEVGVLIERGEIDSVPSEALELFNQYLRR